MADLDRMLAELQSMSENAKRQKDAQMEIIMNGNTHHEMQMALQNHHLALQNRGMQQRVPPVPTDMAMKPPMKPSPDQPAQTYPPVATVDQKSIDGNHAAAVVSSAS